MKRLWKRFAAWLYYLRHPCTIITMDEAPAKGVNVTFSYSGDFEQTKARADELVKRYKSGQSLTEGMDERMNERAFKHAIGWREDEKTDY